MKKYLLSILCGILLLPGCNYLDMVPEKDIETVESLFEQRTKVELWWKGLYAELNNIFADFRVNTAYLGADEFVTCQALHSSTLYNLDGLKIADGLQMSQNPYGSIWYRMYVVIRNCNIFLENVDHTYNMSEEDRNWWKADVKAVKAYVYFELVRRYGPICLVPQNMPVDLPVKDYQLPRQHVDTCFKEIINLLEESMEYVPKHSQRISNYGHTFSLEAVYALKAKVLLYAASPLFNGNAFYSDFKNKNGELLFNSTYDRNKWLLAAEAADKAAEMCEDGGRALVSGATGKKTDLLNKMADIENMSFSRFNNSEYLLEWKYPSTFYQFILPRLVGDDDNFDSQALGCLSPSMKMVEMYYTANGLPIDADITWNYSNRYKLASESSPVYEGVVPMNIDVVNLHLRREPRFYACIAGDRMYWQRGTNTADKDYNFLVKAHKGEEPWGTQYDFIVSNSWQNINGYWLKKHLFSWFNTLGYANNLQGNETAAIIRLAEVYLMQAEAWNEYLDQPDSRVYDPLDKVRERAGVLPVREAWGSYSNNPVKVTTKVGMRDIIHQEYGIEFAFEGHRYWDIRRWLTAHQTMNEKQYGWNVIGTTDQAFYNYETGPVVVYSSNKFIAPRDYLDPFDAEEILISGMVQNPGWGGR
ncbi:MAG: RagB/SusD family nutrient uptake outer membrane protein [Butyricimonas virosa]|uniref:RagB/SusD family nutrient uptake outer membrane protein n=1 Tax=Butyricimonas virosa TaxID=544645 RepID=UPI00242B8B03|nr:RagB/SusD family nutrient uptake outer membrane protein [Butyricimonas virosa]MCI7389617.1 RagB/SusD family nutrient uptake outer membrane protein [Butyricimonas virosa]MDY4903533.1 RagB/SusD family nutrient uptake outer membrane protein [Butyricimonas virosa]MDY5535037.1 RagB/SusD family nutrient uptake outer membrane protein [Butyricimonas virosa]